MEGGDKMFKYERERMRQRQGDRKKNTGKDRAKHLLTVIFCFFLQDENAAVLEMITKFCSD